MPVTPKQSTRTNLASGVIPDFPFAPGTLVDLPGFTEYQQDLQDWWNTVQERMADLQTKEDVRAVSLSKTLNTSTASLLAAITEESEVRVSEDEALATSITAVIAAYQAADTTLAAAVTSEATARATADTAEATARSSAVASLTTSIGTVATSVTTEATARATADGQIHARWGVTIDGNGRIVGRINLDGTNGTSEFKVAVDKFVIENADGTITAMNIRTGGKIVFGADIQSDNYSAGSLGWMLTRAGSLEVNDGTFRGTLAAGGASAIMTDVGLWAGYDGLTYKFRVGDPAGAHLLWDGSTLTTVGLAGSIPQADNPVASPSGTTGVQIDAPVGAPVGYFVQSQFASDPPGIATSFPIIFDNADPDAVVTLFAGAPGKLNSDGYQTSYNMLTGP